MGFGGCVLAKWKNRRVFWISSWVSFLTDHEHIIVGGFSRKNREDLLVIQYKE
jgi:hypothetical protein